VVLAGTAWTTVKVKWELSADEAGIDVMRVLLATCWANSLDFNPT
jgi:hypothetical protein